MSYQKQGGTSLSETIEIALVVATTMTGSSKVNSEAATKDVVWKSCS